MRSFRTIEQICNNLYDANPVQCNPTVVCWAAEKIEDTVLAKRELTALNKRRERWGKIPATFPFGHRLF